MSKRGGPIVLTDDSSDDAEEVDQIREDEDAEPVQLPSRSQRAKRPRSEDGSASEPDAKRQQMIVLDDESEEDDDMPLATPASARARGRKPAVLPDDDDSDEDIVSPTKRRRRLVAAKSASPSPDLPDVAEVGSSKQGVQLQTPKKTQSSPTKRGSRSARTGHRTFKDKQKEVLRRRRQGENITIEELTESSSDEEDQKGEYDTDSDFAALDEFDDEEEEVEGQPSSPLKQHKNRKDKAKKTKSAEKEKPSKGKEHGEYNDEDLEDFVVEDDEGPLGVPADLLRQEIPLEFTSHAHKPLKAHFKDAVEWLVHRRLNPAFDKDDGLYKIAWRKLDDEVRGLAQSKFMSAGWKPEFYKALRARPYLESYELDRNDPDRGEACHACGRSKHPATFKISMIGSAYYKDSLEEVESDSDSEDGSEEEGSRASRDEDGNTLQPQHKEWFVGVVCNSNAETAHSLIHWKHALMDWVGENLERQGLMTAAKLKEREKMKGKKRRRLANETVDQWEASGVIKALWGDFKKNLEEARTKSTTVVGRRGRR
ncbi:uncharacterized protein E0L32_009374 [Thyridium curvatum]|uniref:DUF4211 domain-containing protein n=1 Tax=Thyridium curvatum TaxID=1093900 RepID=A0A507AS08_9PEZI|nr:uncharacterized protein E0L32_009374 [Thyridium curvatum]TPX09486.1 hypothetical protein E0L32_009374 [Thyridium curvatum]